MKVLIIQQKRIGDVLTSSILANILKKIYPDASIDFMCYAHCVDVLKGNSSINNIIILGNKTRKNYLSLLKFIYGIRLQQYNVVIDAYSKLETNLITVFSGAQYRISYDKVYSRIFYNYNVKRLNGKTLSQNGLAIENRLRLLNPILKEKIIDFKPKIFLSKEEIDCAKSLLINNQIDTNKPLFMIGALGSEWWKTYPLKSMAELLDFTVEQTNANLLFNYIPNQKEEAIKLLKLCNESTQNNVHFDIYQNSIRDFLGLLSQCDALIGNEGGAINMAKALQIPTFSLFSPVTDKESWQIFEDEKNISIHLKDLKPELYEQHDLKHMKERMNTYFEAYPVNTIKDKLKLFFKSILK